MLNKEICQKCRFESVKDYEPDWAKYWFNIRWEKDKIVHCKFGSYNHSYGDYSILKEPPDCCTYLLEQMMAKENVK